MKTCTKSVRAVAGMSLLEMTVVIAVLLALISVLVVGSRTWKQGADRSTCVLNIRNTQEAVRAFQHIKELPDGAALALFPDIIGPEGYMANSPHCPGGGHYLFLDYIPGPGELVATCDLAGSLGHEPKDYLDW